MEKVKNTIKNIFIKGDMVLLALAVITSVFGLVMIYAASSVGVNSSRNMIIQVGCIFVGILIYLALTAFDVDILAGQRTLLFLFNAGLILSLLVWGVEISGNRSWLDLPLLPFNIQPAEVCKIFFVIILAKTLSVNQTRISSPRCVFSATFHAGFIFLLYLVISGDMGVGLIFLFAFFIMLYVSGVSGWWFLGGAGLLSVGAPIAWQYVFKEYQKNRIRALFDPSIDPNGRGALWQTNLNKQALKNGGLTGMGLFNGRITNSDALPARHTDSIFSTIGEQLGLVGTIITLLLLLAIVARIIYIGVKSPDFMNRLICIGIASMFFFQIMINVGVCLGLIPVIGLVLPFISYGGSSMLTSFMALGFVSGIKMHPSRNSNDRYIRPY